MKRIVFWVFIFVWACRTEVGAIHISLTATETSGLVQFIMGCDAGGRNAQFLRLKGSSFYTDETRKVLAAWNDIGTSNQLTFNGYPVTRYNNESVLTLVVVQSAYATGVEDLVLRCSGFFRQDDLARFTGVLRHFAPIYAELVWKPHRKDIDQGLERLRNYIHTKSLDDLFTKASAFYGTRWDQELPFMVIVNPLPGRVWNTGAKPMGQVLAADFVLNERDLDAWMGVVFHEMCHVLFKYQPIQKQEELERFFLNHSDSVNRLAAYNWLNEALATALGNGWAVENLAGKMDKGEWYNNSYINKNARAIYPLVKEYVSAAKAIDLDFVNAAIRIFGETFPTINREANHLFTYINMVSDTLPEEWYGNIGQHFEPRYLSTETPLTLANVNEMQALTGTKVYIVTSQHDQTISMLEQRLDLNIDRSANPAVHYRIGHRGHNYFILLLKDASDFGKAMEVVAKQKVLGKQSGVLNLH